MKKVLSALCFASAGALAPNVEGYAITGHAGNAIAVGVVAALCACFGFALLSGYVNLDDLVAGD